MEIKYNKTESLGIVQPDVRQRCNLNLYHCKKTIRLFDMRHLVYNITFISVAPLLLPLLTLVYLKGPCVLHANLSLGQSESALFLLPANHKCWVSSSHDLLTCLSSWCLFAISLSMYRAELSVNLCWAEYAVFAFLPLVTFSRVDILTSQRGKDLVSQNTVIMSLHVQYWGKQSFYIGSLLSEIVWKYLGGNL